MVVKGMCLHLQRVHVSASALVRTGSLCTAQYQGTRSGELETVSSRIVGDQFVGTFFNLLYKAIPRLHLEILIEIPEHHPFYPYEPGTAIGRTTFLRRASTKLHICKSHPIFISRSVFLRTATPRTEVVGLVICSFPGKETWLPLIYPRTRPPWMISIRPSLHLSPCAEQSTGFHQFRRPMCIHLSNETLLI